MNNTDSSIPLVCIVGSSRSGTTMLNRILGNHPAILGLNELHFFGRIWDMDPASRWDRAKAIKEAADLFCVARRSIWNNGPSAQETETATSLVDDALARSSSGTLSPQTVFAAVMGVLLNEAGKSMATDQTPRNILYAEKILAMFPEAKIIQLIRDPRAVLYSQKNRWKQRSLGFKDTPVTNLVRVFVNYHPFTTCKLWLAACRKGKKLQGNNNYMAVKFEDLVDSPETVVGNMCTFLGLDFFPYMLDVPQVGSSNAVHNANAKGVSRSVVDAWQGKLSPAELWICQKMAAAEMAELDYSPVPVALPVPGLIRQALTYPLHAAAAIAVNPRLVFRVLKRLNN